MDIKSDLRIICDKVYEYKKSKMDLNEEDTKRCLIVPFFKLLGYDTENLLEFRGEYVLDCREKGSERVDYAIIINEKPHIIIEAKKFVENLDIHIGQLQRYYNTNIDIKYAILTNGTVYMFFTDYEHTNIMDKTPFYIIDLNDLKESDVEILNYLKKDMIVNIKDKINPVDNFIKSKKIYNYIEQQLNSPDDSFIKFISENSKIKDISKEDIIKAINSCNLSKDNKQEVIDTVVNESSPESLTENEDIKNTKVSKDTKRINKPKISQLFDNGLLKSGDVLYIKTAPDEKAVVIDAKTVEYKGEKLTYNQWGNAVTKWSTICIYDYAVQERTNKLLDSLRNEL